METVGSSDVKQMSEHIWHFFCVDMKRSNICIFEIIDDILIFLHYQETLDLLFFINILYNIKTYFQQPEPSSCWRRRHSQMNHTLASRPSSSISIKPASSSLASLTNQIRTFVVALRAGRNQSDKANTLLNYLQCSFYQSDKKQVHIMATIVLFFMLATLSHSADAFVAPFLTNNNKVDLMSSRSVLLLSNDDISNTELDWQAKTPLSSTTTSKQPFQATPITLSIKKDEPKEIVNISTIRFNNKLNEMSKNVDATTASKVESLLLEALENYQSHIASHPQDIHPKDMIIPNTISFTNAIAAWARCTRKDSPYRAQELLDKMHSLYSTSGMKHVRPNKISYNSVINAWAKSKEYRSARKAEKLLMRLFEFYEESGGDGELKPDATSFNSVINAGE